MNGRISYSNDFTYCGPTGTSVIDYVLTTYDMFEYVKKFIVCNFNSYSDHAPLHIEFKSSFHVQNRVTMNRNVIDHSKFRWNDTFKNESKIELEQNIHVLRQCVTDNDLSTDSGVDNCVSTFIEKLNNIMSDFHKVSVKFSNNDMNPDHQRSKISKISFDKPWFNPSCKRLFSKYRK